MTSIKTKYVSWECKFRFDGRKCNLNQKWIKVNVKVMAKIQENPCL